jgi:pimeloyl-ACP methyl ester carboxylesterase
MQRFGRSLTLWLFAAMLAVMLAIQPAHAEPVSNEYLGLEVNGNLELAPGKTLRTDGAVLIVHGTLAHHRLEMIAALQNNLKQRGVNSLAITLSLGLNRRQGMFDCKLEHDHRHGDAADEIVSWVEWLQSKGASKITVLGHSRGGSQAALALVERGDVGVARLILAAPLLQSETELAARYQEEHGQTLAPLLAKARKHVEDGEGDTLLDVPGFLYCRPARVTAAAFHDYYEPDPQHNVLRLLEQINTPALLILAGDDRIVPSLAPAVKVVQGENRLGARTVVETIDGADHFFRDLFGDELADRVAAFVTKP